MRKMLTRSALCAALTLSPVALAQDALLDPVPQGAPPAQPRPEAVKATWDYFQRGQGQGPVLVEAKLCTEVAKDGPRKFECVAEADPVAGIRSGTPVMLWQAYLVPLGDTVDDLVVQTKQGHTVRDTRTVKLTGEGWRLRQWTALRLQGPGRWTVSVLRGNQTLRTLQVKVK